MFKNTLYGILLTFGGAMLLFLGGFAGWQLGVIWLASGLYALATKVIWLAFTLLLLLQAGWIVQAFWLGFVNYFRKETMALRRMAMLQIRRRDIRQRHILEKRQLQYLSQLKRQRLLAADDKKHSSELFEAINAEFRHYMTPVSYKAFRKELNQHRKQANPQAMLALREQMLCQSFAG